MGKSLRNSGNSVIQTKNTKKVNRTAKMIAKAWHARRALLVLPNSQPCLLNNGYHDSSQLSVQFLGEEDLFLRFQEADLFQMRAMSKRKYQQSLSSFSRPKTLDLRFFSSPCSLCARLLLSRTSQRMARSWFARALSVALQRICSKSFSFCRRILIRLKAFYFQDTPILQGLIASCHHL